MKRTQLKENLNNSLACRRSDFIYTMATRSASVDTALKSVVQKHTDWSTLFSKSDFFTMTGFLDVVFISGRKVVIQVPIITVLESYETFG
jgi:uncharacterized membrane protein